MNVCGLILAAGGSSRLGRPKQLMKANGKTLLEHAILNALKCSLQEVYVVLGAHYEKIETSVKHLPLTIIRNSQWQEGMGSSISIGITAVMEADKYDACIIMVCDQLHVSTNHLQALMAAYDKNKSALIATAYGKQTGVPALFDQQFFPELEKLSGDSGAKKILIQNTSQLHSIPFEQALIDIDTPEDLIKTGLNGDY